jgi:hypothetical protein
MSRTYSFLALLVASFLIGLIAWHAPLHQMPIDFHAMFWLSFPLTILWSVLFLIALSLFRWKALWMLLFVSFAYYWPVWLLVNGLPACYRLGNCV